MAETRVKNGCALAVLVCTILVLATVVAVAVDYMLHGWDPTERKSTYDRTWGFWYLTRISLPWGVGADQYLCKLYNRLCSERPNLAWVVLCGSVDIGGVCLRATFRGWPNRGTYVILTVTAIVFAVDTAIVAWRHARRHRTYRRCGWTRAKNGQVVGVFISSSGNHVTYNEDTTSSESDDVSVIEVSDTDSMTTIVGSSDEEELTAKSSKSLYDLIYSEMGDKMQVTRISADLTNGGTEAIIFTDKAPIDPIKNKSQHCRGLLNNAIKQPAHDPTPEKPTSHAQHISRVEFEQLTAKQLNGALMSLMDKSSLGSLPTELTESVPPRGVCDPSKSSAGSSGRTSTTRPTTSVGKTTIDQTLGQAIVADTRVGVGGSSLGQAQTGSQHGTDSPALSLPLNCKGTPLITTTSPTPLPSELVLETSISKSRLGTVQTATTQAVRDTFDGQGGPDESLIDVPDDWSAASRVSRGVTHTTP